MQADDRPIELQRVFKSDDSTLWLYAPSLRFTIQKRTLQFDMEAGTELSRRNAMLPQHSTRYFYNLGYRWQF